MDWINLIKVLLPTVLVAAKVPHAEDISPIVAHAINEAEQLKTSGESKLEHSLSIANDSLAALNVFRTTAPLDLNAINKNLREGISLSVDVANLIKRKGQVQ